MSEKIIFKTEIVKDLPKFHRCILLQCILMCDASVYTKKICRTFNLNAFQTLSRFKQMVKTNIIK